MRSITPAGPHQNKGVGLNEEVLEDNNQIGRWSKGMDLPGRSAVVPIRFVRGRGWKNDQQGGDAFVRLDGRLAGSHRPGFRLHQGALAASWLDVLFGQGTVGNLIAQLARHAGAHRVLAVEPIALRREIALRTGVDEALEPGEDLTERVQASTGGRGADVAIEASGAGAALQAAI